MKNIICRTIRKVDVLVIARFRVQYDQYFPSLSYFADLFHELLGQ